MSLLRRVSFLLVLVVFIGCGGGRESGQTVEPPPSDAKATLQEIATTGNLAAKQAELRVQLEGMGEEGDPAKAEELLADFEQLSGLTDAAGIKAKAQEMADKL